MSARLERQRRRRRRGGAARVIIITISVLVACCIIGVLSAIGYVVGLANSAPDLASLRPQDPGRLSTVYASDGQKLGTIQNDVLRAPIQTKEMPQNVRDATVAIEDQRFYQHKGVDFEGVIRAALKNATSGKTVQGGSTLTMQLIRNIYISGERTFSRKVREAKLAEELENFHPGRAGKEWILTKYLNSVPYGTNGGQTAVGIQAAARAFFDKPASQLNLQEAALLAGLPQAPSAYNPFREPGRATARRNDVLRKMADEGYISAGAAQDAIGAPLDLHPNGYFQQKRESYFFDYVTDELIKEYGIKTVRGGGLRINTTIDLSLQRKARAAIKKSLDFPGAPSSAIVSIDPSNGYIRTMASSAKYKDSKFNLAADAKRQPGSSFKVMALVAAVNAGVNPATTSYPSGHFKQFVPKWGDIDVNCYGGKCSGGSKNLIAATLTSDNTVYIRLALDLGPDKVKAAARGLGITSKLEGVPAETLGGLARCCSPLEMADAYATIASGGWRNKPKAITEVRHPDGTVDDLSKPIRHKAFDSAAMYEVQKILQQNIKSGTGVRANIGCPAAGKTGTTDKNQNAWFVGFTPKLATSTWVGFPKGNIAMPNLFHGGPVDGGTFPAEIWGNYMKAAKGKFCGQFPKPSHPFKTKPLKGRFNRGRAAPVIVAPRLPSRPKTDPGVTKANPGGVAVPPSVTKPPPPPATGGFDPDKYKAPGATPAPPPPPAQTPPEQVATPP
ncbi:MAG: penicillin-binding protein [Solirubrobacteraceae bacterium]|jgi:penicillin-binding protein 1A|nr:penicillin-binding protein [Solirubrobacteraceae bacterium]